MQQNTAPATTSHLSRSLGLWAIVGLGLGYMTPMTVFDTFAFPSAGSAFTYASEVIHPNVGFLVGWSSLLDYLLLPMVNAVIGRIYFESFFPDAPSWIFVLVYVAIVTALNCWSIKGTSNINGVLVVFQTVLFGAFVVLTYLSLSRGHRGRHRGVLLVHRVRRDHDVQRRGEDAEYRPEGHRSGPPHRRCHLPARCVAQSNTPVEIFTNIVLPVIGMTLTVVLWLNLHFDALLYDAIWFVIGLVLFLYVTRGLRKPLTMRIEEETLAEEGTPIEDVEHRRTGENK